MTGWMGAASRPAGECALSRAGAGGLIAFRPGGVQPVHGDKAESEVADLGQQSMQRGLVSQRPADNRLVVLGADLEAVEPGGPPAVKDTRHADLIPGRP